jgi:hypothetical protein
MGKNAHPKYTRPQSGRGPVAVERERMLQAIERGVILAIVIRKSLRTVEDAWALCMR